MSPAIAMAIAGIPKAVIAPRACDSNIIPMTGTSTVIGKAATATGATITGAAAIIAAASGSRSSLGRVFSEDGGTPPGFRRFFMREAVSPHNGDIHEDQ